MAFNPAPLNARSSLLFIGLIAVLLPVGAFAQDTATEIRPISFKELAEPPKEIAELIRRGDVTMKAGRRSEAEMLEIQRRSSFSGPMRRLAGETTFELSYKTRNKTRWRTSGSGDNRVVTITVTFQEGKIIKKHSIWFRRRPRTDGFWSNSLVLHEFDHVKISCHPKFDDLFREKLNNARTIRHKLSAGETVDNDLVQRLINKRAGEVFQEVLDLVAIRYRELDRLTAHGLKPIPEDSDSPIKGLLQTKSD